MSDPRARLNELSSESVGACDDQQHGTGRHRDTRAGCFIALVTLGSSSMQVKAPSAAVNPAMMTFPGGLFFN